MSDVFENIAKGFETLVNTKEDIRTAINEVGGQVTSEHVFADYADRIRAIPVGSSNSYVRKRWEQLFPWTDDGSSAIVCDGTNIRTGKYKWYKTNAYLVDTSEEQIYPEVTSTYINLSSLEDGEYFLLGGGDYSVGRLVPIDIKGFPNNDEYWLSIAFDGVTGNISEFKIFQNHASTESYQRGVIGVIRITSGKPSVVEDYTNAKLEDTQYFGEFIINQERLSDSDNFYQASQWYEYNQILSKSLPNSIPSLNEHSQTMYYKQITSTTSISLPEAFRYSRYDYPIQSILVQIYMPTVQTINLGTTHFFQGETPDMSQAGYYNIIYEWDANLQDWFCGVVYKGL